MKGLIWCEESQEVAGAFIEAGHDFYSLDIKESSGKYPSSHIRSDLFHHLSSRIIHYDFLGTHPVCKFLANSGVCWLASKKEKNGFTWSEKYQIYINEERFKQMEIAALFFKSCLSCVETVGRGYVENPIMHKYAMEIIQKKPTQIIQPWMFGHKESKATCLWLVGLPELKPTNIVKDEMMLLPNSERQRLHYLPPGKNRDTLRSKTFPGIAKAMANQWSNI